MKTVYLRRKGHAVRGYDRQLERGWDVSDGDEVRLSELAAMELQRDDPEGWEIARTELDADEAKGQHQDVIKEGR